MLDLYCLQHVRVAYGGLVLDHRSPLEDDQQPTPEWNQTNNLKSKATLPRTRTSHNSFKKVLETVSITPEGLRITNGMQDRNFP